MVQKETHRCGEFTVQTSLTVDRVLDSPALTPGSDLNCNLENQSKLRRAEKNHLCLIVPFSYLYKRSVFETKYPLDWKVKTVYFVRIIRVNLWLKRVWTGKLGSRATPRSERSWYRPCGLKTSQFLKHMKHLLIGSGYRGELEADWVNSWIQAFGVIRQTVVCEFVTWKATWNWPN